MATAQQDLYQTELGGDAPKQPSSDQSEKSDEELADAPVEKNEKEVKEKKPRKKRKRVDTKAEVIEKLKTTDQKYNQALSSLEELRKNHNKIDNQFKFAQERLALAQQRIKELEHVNGQLQYLIKSTNERKNQQN